MQHPNPRIPHPPSRLPRWRVPWWYFLWSLCYAWMGLWYRYRCWCPNRVPRHGPVLLVSNHQSFLDPILVGLGVRRPFFALARSGLFDNALFGWLIRSLNAISVRQGAGDKSAMKTCIEVLRQGRTLLIFPEGARTLDGRAQPFNPGTMLMIRRARPLVVPVAIEGAFHAWPRNKARPHPFGRIYVQYGPPVAAETLIAMGPEAALLHLYDQVETMRLELSARMAGSKPPGSGIK